MKDMDPSALTPEQRSQLRRSIRRDMTLVRRRLMRPNPRETRLQLEGFLCAAFDYLRALS